MGFLRKGGNSAPVIPATPDYGGGLLVEADPWATLGDSPLDATPNTSGTPDTGLASRLGEMVNDPETKARAIKLGREFGGAALRGAIEGTGAVRVREDGSIKVKKGRAALAVLRPTRTARKAVQGAAGGVRGEVRSQAQDAAVGALRSRFKRGNQGTTPNVATSTYPEAAVDPWADLGGTNPLQAELNPWGDDDLL